MLKYVVSVSAFALVVLTGSAAMAQENQSGDSVTSSQVSERNGVREQTFDFRDEVVQGSLLRPEGDVLGGRRRPRTISLIRMRQHFVPEMLKSVENL